MDDTRLKQLEISIEEIKESQNKIAAALLGSYEKNSIGLIEESRNLRRDVEDLKSTQKIHQVQINEQQEFKSDAKKVVAGIAIVVPFILELLKFLGKLLMAQIKGE